MSRIDDALRIADGGSRTAPSQPQGSSSTFVSPWSLTEHAPEANPTGDAPLKPMELPRVEPAPRLRVVRPAAVDSFDAEWRPRLATGEMASPAVSQQFRRLAASLIQAQRTRPIKTLLVTSAVAGDGKTLTALNLALVLSESYKRRVLLVEADLHRPMIANIAMLPVTEGLADVIRRSDEQKAPLIQITEALTLLPAGRVDGDSLSGITSARMQHLLQDAAEQHDWVIIDTPPLVAGADAALLCSLTDGALLVIRSGRTSFPAIKEAIDALGQERILGVVLNGVDERSLGPTETRYAEYRESVTHT